jgi:putative solute:sodium symporter small subunit
MAENKDAYWKETVGLIYKVLIVWFLISYGAGIMFAGALNNISLGGYPLGFWFAQQGSIYGFIALIFIYAKLMAKIDEKHDVQQK